MDLFLPDLPKVLYVGTPATYGPRFISWLKDVCKIQVIQPGTTTAIDAQAQEAGAQLILMEADTPQALDICRHLRQSPHTQHLPVIALDSQTARAHETALLETGAIDYIAEPIEYTSFIARIKTHLSYQFSAGVLRAITVQLENEVERHTAEISATQDVTILALATLAETRDNSTGYHIQRTQHYVRALGRHLSHNPRFADFLTRHNIDLLFKSAPLHDIGKVGIPDRILLKPGRLEPDEFAIMKTHPLLGKQALENAERRLGQQVGFLTIAKEIAYCHHEKWDGSGYPQGLKGEAIPISARLMALADVYDAIVSRRVYKDKIAHEQAVDIIIQGRGSHFDPDLVDAFVEIEDEFKYIALRFDDGAWQECGTSEFHAHTATEKKAEVRPPVNESASLLLALQARIDALSSEAIPFVFSILAGTSTVPKPLAQWIADRLVHQAPIELGPVHHALARMFRAQQQQTKDAEQTRSDSMALIQACRSSKAANTALQFIFELPSLLAPDGKLVTPDTGSTPSHPAPR